MDIEQIVIRPSQPADAAGIHAVRLQPSVLRYTLSLPSQRLVDVQASLQGNGVDDHSFVAVAGEQVIGAAGLHVARGKRRHSGEIGMMVHDDWQGRGVGGRLLATLLEVADGYLGLTRVELTVMADNPRAIALYERHGFAHEGRKRNAILRADGYVDLLVMARVREHGTATSVDHDPMELHLGQKNRARDASVGVMPVPEITL